MCAYDLQTHIEGPSITRGPAVGVVNGQDSDDLITSPEDLDDYQRGGASSASSSTTDEDGHSYSSEDGKVEEEWIQVPGDSRHPPLTVIQRRCVPWKSACDAALCLEQPSFDSDAPPKVMMPYFECSAKCDEDGEIADYFKRVVLTAARRVDTVFGRNRPSREMRNVLPGADNNCLPPPNLAFRAKDTEGFVFLSFSMLPLASPHFLDAVDLLSFLFLSIQTTSLTATWRKLKRSLPLVPRAFCKMTAL